MNTVIIGGLHHNTLGVIRSIGEKIGKDNIHILIISCIKYKKNIISTSKFVTKENLSYIDTYDKVVPFLKNLMKDNVKRIVFCCSDGATEQVIGHQNELKDGYLMPNTGIDIDLLLSKENQAIYAKESGIKTPKSKIIKRGENINWMYFPSIIKPIKSTIGAGKADIKIVHNNQELVALMNIIDAESVQIQNYIEKDFEYQLIGCSLNGGEKIIIPGYTNIIRQPYNTNTGYLKYSPIIELEYDKEAVEKFIKKIGYSGLFSIEFIRGKDGVDYFLEINMRNDGNAYCVHESGVNLPYIWYYYMKNKTIPEDESITSSKSVMFIPDFNDFSRGVKEVGLLSWIKQFFSAEAHSIYNKKDMRPFWTQFGLYIKKFLHIK